MNTDNIENMPVIDLDLFLAIKKFGEASENGGSITAMDKEAGRIVSDYSPHIHDEHAAELAKDLAMLISMKLIGKDNELFREYTVKKPWPPKSYWYTSKDLNHAIAVVAGKYYADGN